MRKLICAAITSALIAGAPATAAPIAKSEAKLQKILEGRVAGEPVDCVRLTDIRSSRIIDRTAIVYEGRNNTVYVNRPDAGAQSLSSWDVMVSRPFSNQLCDVDVVNLYDPGSRMQSGVVFLGEFVPYKKVAASRAD